MPSRPRILGLQNLPLFSAQTSTPLVCRSLPPRRNFTSTPFPHAESQAHASTNSKPPISSFKRPIAKCFLGAMLTYQILYWAWLKLETDEIKAHKGMELAMLEDEVRRRTSKSS